MHSLTNQSYSPMSSTASLVMTRAWAIYRDNMSRRLRDLAVMKTQVPALQEVKIRRDYWKHALRSAWYAVKIERVLTPLQAPVLAAFEAGAATVEHAGRPHYQQYALARQEAARVREVARQAWVAAGKNENSFMYVVGNVLSVTEQNVHGLMLYTVWSEAGALKLVADQILEGKFIAAAHAALYEEALEDGRIRR